MGNEDKRIQLETVNRHTSLQRVSLRLGGVVLTYCFLFVTSPCAITLWTMYRCTRYGIITVKNCFRFTVWGKTSMRSKYLICSVLKWVPFSVFGQLEGRNDIISLANQLHLWLRITILWGHSIWLILHSLSFIIHGLGLIFLLGIFEYIVITWNGMIYALNGKVLWRGFRGNMFLRPKTIC